MTTVKFEIYNKNWICPTTSFIFIEGVNFHTTLSSLSLLDVAHEQHEGIALSTAAKGMHRGRFCQISSKTRSKLKVSKSQNQFMISSNSFKKRTKTIRHSSAKLKDCKVCFLDTTSSACLTRWHLALKMKGSQHSYTAG